MSDPSHVTLREFFDMEVASIRKDISVLSQTIKDTAQAHALSHDRDHEQTKQATDKAERQLTIQLELMAQKFERFDVERRHQIEGVENQINEQAKRWSNLEGRMLGIGIAFTGLSLVSGFLALWSALS